MRAGSGRGHSRVSAHGSHVVAHGAADGRCSIGPLFGEFWFEPRVKADEVVQDQNLAVTAFAAPDADGRDLQGRANLRGRER